MQLLKTLAKIWLGGAALALVLDVLRSPDPSPPTAFHVLLAVRYWPLSVMHHVLDMLGAPAGRSRP